NLGYPPGTLFHPTFLYEMLWNLAAAAVLVVVAKRLQLRHGRQFWLYVMLYTAGRVWIEMLRIDAAEHIFGLRLNVWTSLITFAIATALFIRLGRNRQRPDPIWLPGRGPNSGGDEHEVSATNHPDVHQEISARCDEQK
ncbi:MAG: prolipoprotein diacylglyceryl transferase, partial [Bowdeniella nasicola]|nr:prolipoprotein diacylglyceryl transferase [Bowdeniella nasicola]